MLFCSIQLRPCPAEVVRRQLAHQELEVTLALYLAGLQQILHQLEDRDDEAEGQADAAELAEAVDELRHQIVAAVGLRAW